MLFKAIKSRNPDVDCNREQKTKDKLKKFMSINKQMSLILGNMYSFVIR